MSKLEFWTDVIGFVLLGICGLISLLTLLHLLPFGLVTFLVMAITGGLGAVCFSIDGDNR